MTQYCRYCAFCIYGDIPYCTAKDEPMTERQMKRKNTCKEFALSELGDVESGKPYKPRRKNAETLSVTQIRMDI